MSQVENKPQDPHYWRSLGELADTPEFKAYLNKETAVENPGDIDSFSRRRFMQLMGASMAMTTMSGCFWEEEKLKPLAKRPEGFIPGKPRLFTSLMDMGGSAQPLLVTSHDGRPTKIDGNPKHRQSQGASTIFAQSSILTMYDPDRSKTVHKSGAASTWAEFDGFFKGKHADLTASRGEGLYVLAENISSPTFHRWMKAFSKAYPKAKVVTYEAVNKDGELAGTQLAFGEKLRAHYELSGARVVACFDDDLLNSGPESMRITRDFADARDPDAAHMLRLYAVESFFSGTGGSADHRLPVTATEVVHCLLALESSVRGQVDASGNPVSGALPQLPEAQAKFVSALAKDLVNSRGKAVVTVGAHLGKEAHAIAHKINSMLDSVGKVVTYTEAPAHETGNSLGDLANLAGDLKAGKVDTLLILGGNPVYSTPADLDFAGALGKAKASIHLSHYIDETSEKCSWHVPATHFLETWTDGKTFDGSYLVGQPLISPLYKNTFTAAALVAYVTNLKTVNMQEEVKSTFSSNFGGLNVNAWRKAVHDGFAGEVAKRVEPSLDSFKVSVPAKSQGLELVLTPCSKVYDGRFANNSWLQELPDFLTKVTWDNPLLVSKAYADKNGLKTGSLVSLDAAGKSMTAAVWIQPGLAEHAAVLALGQGRSKAGQVGGWVDLGKELFKSYQADPVGFNAYLIQDSKSPFVLSDVKVTNTGKTYTFASTQEHHLIDQTGMDEREVRLRELVRESDLDNYKKHPDFAKHTMHYPKGGELYNAASQEGHAWGMTIDLNRCTGCNGCIIACQSENNIPVVGKQQVEMGREMQWLRLDTYYKSKDAGLPEKDKTDPLGLADPQLVYQPVTCHHCENAPCEQVCPFGATTHSHEGLNDMVYNRCGGTRYCANNCPYKVRRYNFFDYNLDLKKETHEVAKLKFNPEVTVRNRGVMEKCTFCVQRIQNGKIDAKNKGETLKDGQITTACAQACPANAIVFGDLADKNSQVAQNQAGPRSYAMLEELNVKPRTQYLARVRNPNPELTPVKKKTHEQHH